MPPLPTIAVIQFASPQAGIYLPGYLLRRMAEALADCLALAVAGLPLRNPLFTSPDRRYILFTDPPTQPAAADYAARLQADWLVTGVLTDAEEYALDLLLFDASGKLCQQRRFVEPQQPAAFVGMVEMILANIGLSATLPPAAAVAQALGSANEQAVDDYWQARDVAPRYGLANTGEDGLVFDRALHALSADPAYQRAAALYAEAALDLSASSDPTSEATMQRLAALREVTAGTPCAPITASAYFSLGLKADQQRGNKQALEYYTLALQADPDNVAALAHLGDLRYRLGMREQALPLLLRACELNPSDEHSAWLVARIYEMQEQPDAALQWYAKAAAARSDFWQAHFYAADLLRRLNRPEEAVAEFERTLAIDPKQAQTHAELGAVLAELGRPAEAIPHLEQAAAALPEVAEIQANIATVKAMMSEE